MTVSQHPTLAERLVDRLGRIDAEALPESTRSAVLRNSLQILGSSRLGLGSPIGRASVEYARRWEAGDAATIVGSGILSGTVGGAVFANAASAHADFREDTHAESASHPGVVVIPAVLAIAEQAGGALPAGRYVEAVVAGHELIGLLGRAAAQQTTERGFRPPSVYTVFGGTLAAAQALGLDRGQQVNALAIAAQGASGITHPFSAGSDEWFLAPAFAARQAVMSALLAAGGLEGSPSVFEGPDGVFSAFAGDADIEVGLERAGSGEWEIERTRLKCALTCGWNQSLVHQLGLLGLQAEDVESLSVRQSRLAAEYPGVASYGPFRSQSSALLSAPFAAALQLVRGSLDHEGYRHLEDALVVETARKVTVGTDPGLEGYATSLEVVLTSGETIRSADGNDHPGFSLDTVERVETTLRRNYAAAGQDPEGVAELRAGIESIIASGDAGSLGRALGASYAG